MHQRGGQSGTAYAAATASKQPCQQDLSEMGPLGIAGNLLVFAALGFFAPMR